MYYSDASYRRRMAIEDELLALLQEVPFEQITVLDIAQRQNMARKTFYRYFSNKQTCLEGLLDRTIYECSIRVLRHAEQSGDERQQYEGWLTFWMEHQPLLDVIIRDRLDYLLVQRLAVHTREEDDYMIERLGTEKMPCDDDILHFYLAGQMVMLLKWCSEGFTRPMEEMVEKLQRLFHEPLIALPGR